MLMTSSSVPSQTSFKPGGTLLITSGSTTGRVITQTSDSLGRWSTQTFTCKSSQHLTIITAYQPCLQPIVTGTKIHTLTTTAQQSSILCQQGQLITPREAFKQDLALLLHDLHQQNHKIILYGDFNEVYSNASSLQQLCTKYTLVNVMTTFIGHTNFSTYSRSSNIIHYVFCNQHTYHSIINAFFEPYQYRTCGNHWNIAIDFDTRQLFGIDTYTLATSSTCGFTSTDPTVMKKYISQKYTHLVHHNFEARLQQAQHNFNPILAESLDKDFQQLSFHAAKSCQCRPNIAFVRKIVNLRKQKKVLWQIITAYKQNISLDHSIAFTMLEGNNFTIPNTLSECQTQCRKIQTEI